MKKTIFPGLLLLLSSFSLKAQLNTQLLYNTWIKVKATYNNDKPIEYATAFKYSYTKYTFSSNGKVGINMAYSSNSLANSFLTNDSVILVSSSLGYELNRFKIMKLTADEMILVQGNGADFNQPGAWKIYLVTQDAFQRSHKFQSDEYSLMANRDTVYNESPYIYPEFTGGDSFQHYMQEQIRKTVLMDQQEGHFIATFIVNKTGGIDSLKILNGINADFDKAFQKSFVKSQTLWKAAMLHGKAVSVKVSLDLKYFTSDKMMPAMRMNTDADNALWAGKYDIALHYYEQSLTYVPDDMSNIYKSALCKLALGRTDGVCEALVQINRSGTMIVDELIGLVCQPSK